MCICICIRIYVYTHTHTHEDKNNTTNKLHERTLLVEFDKNERVTAVRSVHSFYKPANGIIYTRTSRLKEFVFTDGL